MPEKNIPIGLNTVYYAVMTDETTEAYSTPKRLQGGIQITASPTVNSTTLYADDMAYDNVSSMGDVAVTLNVAEISTENLAEIMGNEVVDENGGLAVRATDSAPYVALLYRRRLANGKHRYVILYKGRFQPSEDDAQTKGETPTYQTPSLTGTFIARQSDGLWKYTVTEGDASVDPEFLEGFFNSVYVPGE